jgi:hypothetical protein
MPGLFTGERLPSSRLIDLETVPFWASLITCHSALAGYASRHLNAPSLVLSIIACPSIAAIRFSGFAFCFPLSTCVYQAHAEGRGCLLFTREAGVVSCMDMQLRRSNDLRRSSPALVGSFERTGRTRTVRAIFTAHGSSRCERLSCWRRRAATGQPHLLQLHDTHLTLPHVPVDLNYNQPAR